MQNEFEVLDRYTPPFETYKYHVNALVINPVGEFSEN